MKKAFDTRAMVRCALFAALICVLSPFSIQIGPVPITMSLFAVMLCGVALDWRGAGLAVLVYLLIGLVGLPVFSGGKGGAAVIVGPTGGYIWAYLPMAVLIGAFTRNGGWVRAAVVCALSLLLCYGLGTLQFCLVANYSFGAALAVCVWPFVPFDIAKAVCAALLGTRIRRLS